MTCNTIDEHGTDAWLSRQGELVEKVGRAYQRARSEVFDLPNPQRGQLSPRQQRVLADLEVAEDELRGHRVAHHGLVR
jgi:hypothetical protein